MASHCMAGGLPRLLLASLGLALAEPVGAHGVDRWATQIEEASARFGVPGEWIRSVMKAESGGDTRLGGRPIVSRAGAMGLMQLMPGTWNEMRSLLGLGLDPHDPRDNILAGSFYLRLMYDRFGYPGLFAAYNAGPQRYAAFLAGGRPFQPRLALISTRLLEGSAGHRKLQSGRCGACSLCRPVTRPRLALRLERNAPGMASSCRSAPFP